ncbi:DUF4232 domain-containing protein [Actinoplanes sp. KI2]|uniref:DUF4232 domain-containing protein n=1 Tax=Actinoplanes sp. KI2 TaxID=2983315 RepID=UPI0021D599C2|nr:DUF4232 domain-containing protein [Actinoplanes sp. KI2]MCU7729225.1 DUF4232 domain-containing protein [Actinoplanes sp. KI2]
MRASRVLTLIAALATAACTGAPASEPTSPTASAPASASAASADCPAPGVLITADRGDAAAGYREMTLTLRRCGDTSYLLQGRPDIVVLDERLQPLKVTVGPSVHYTADPRRINVRPGEGAMAVLSWHNTVTEGTAVTGVALSVAPVQGAPRQIVNLPVPMDLGTTGRLDTSAWL